MIDSPKFQDKQAPETLFTPSKEELGQAFVEHVKCAPRFEGCQDIARISEGLLFVASGVPGITVRREFYAVRPSNTGEVDFFLETGVGFMYGVQGSEYKYEPYYLVAGGEHGTQEGGFPGFLAEDNLFLDFHYDSDYFNGVAIPKLTSCRAGFAHKGRVSILYDNLTPGLSRLHLVGHLIHQEFEGGIRERAVDTARLDSYQVKRLMEEKKVVYRQGKYSYQFVIQDENVQTTITEGAETKDEIKFPLYLNNCELFQKLADMGLLEDPLETPPSLMEKNYVTLLRKDIVDWVSCSKPRGYA